MSIIDPYGLSTTLTYGGPGGALSQVMEPAGRWLKINYITVFGDQVIGSVQAGYGASTITQSVTYSYQQFSAGPYNYTTLTGAAYSDGTSAAYTYQPANTYPGTAPPLIRTCDDVRYPGPMKKVAYEFAAQPAENQGGIYGEFATARKWLYPAPFVVSYGLLAHTEQRGDGPLRSFTYGPGDPTDEDSVLCVPQSYLLGSYTDFKGNSTSRCYDSNGFLSGVRDANGNATSFTRTSLTGKLLTITHPTDATGVYSTIRFSYADPVTAYYLQSVTDEMQHTTVYQRDTNNRIKEIDYPDTASETFIYNGFGQVLSHKMTSGGTETFGYNGRGLKLIYRDPYHANGNPTARYQYDALDRVSGVTDARGGYPDDPNYTTNFEHNQRGQVTKVTHPNDPANPAIRYTVVIEYNDDGTVRGVTDESGHAATYAYDDYKRLQSITASPAYNGDATPRTTYFYYDKTGGTGTDYTHADANVTHLTTPLGKTVKTLYDENFWKRSVTAGTGAEAATTTFTYDAVGNLRTVQDPNGQATGAFTEYFYDKRNRLTDVNDPISTDRNTLGHTISWTYDQAGNKKSQLRANNQLVTYDQYDAMNRLQVQSVQRDTATIDQTVMAYDAAGNLITFTDGRQKQYNYRYDFLNRRIVAIYPQDDAGIQREEAYHYNSANNLDMFTDRAGAIQVFEYDNRNRQTHYYWDTWPQYTLHERWLTYDPVGNITRVRTEGEDIVDLVYDWRNRKTSETQTPNGRPARTIGFTYDADSNRKTLAYPSGYQLTYNYNTRNQLREEVDSGGPVVTYTYDLSGNRTRRDLPNGTSTLYYPNALNRPLAIRHFRGGTVFGNFEYGYDKVSRISQAKRDYDRGDVYDYYLDDQLKTAQFEADMSDYPSGGPANTTSLAYDANGNRTSQTNTGSESYTYAVNDLNQYTSVNASVPVYDIKGNLKEFDGRAYGYNRNNQLTAAAVNGTAMFSFHYDGLGRQIVRGDSQWTYSAWDGWNLLEEYDVNGNVIHTYVHGATTDEFVARFDPGPAPNRIWYYQDAQGNTTHLADDSGYVIEKYKYDPALAGAPSIYNSSGQQLPSSNVANRFLYTGREYYQEGGFYDYRNRIYLPSLGRFLQPDPIGFAGDSNNLYRYCGGDPVNWADDDGLQRRGAGGRGMPYYPPRTQEQIDRGMIRNPNPGPNDELFRIAREQGQIYRIITDAILKWIKEHFFAPVNHGDYPRPADPGKPQPNGPRAPMNVAFLSVNSSGIVLFGRSVSTGAALWNAGAGWQPIGNAPADVRWAPNSGTGNYVASQFTHYAQGTWGMYGTNDTGDTGDAGHTIFHPNAGTPMGHLEEGVVVASDRNFIGGQRDPRWVFPSQSESARLGLSFGAQRYNDWLIAHNPWAYGGR